MFQFLVAKYYITLYVFSEGLSSFHIYFSFLYEKQIIFIYIVRTPGLELEWLGILS